MPYMGNISVPDGTTFGCSANWKIACRFQCPTSFIGKRMGVYLTQGLNPGEYGRLGIYNDSAGEPSSIIRTTVQFEGTSVIGWYHSDIYLDYYVTAGTWYWLAFATDGAGVGGFGGAGGTTRTNSDLFADNMSNPFGAASNGTSLMSIYASDWNQPPNFIGNGDLNAGGAVMTASTGKIVAAIPNTTLYAGGGVDLISNIDKMQPNTDDSVSYAEIWTGGSNFGHRSFDAAMDSSNNIHMVAAADATSTRDVAYAVATYSGGNWTIGTWEQVAAYTNPPPNSPGASIAIDSNDYPHIAFVDNVKVMGSAGDNVYYTERTGGSWSTPYQIGLRVVKTDSYDEPRITIRNSDYVEIIYRFVTNGDLAYQSYTGSWSGESVYTETAVDPGDIIATTGGTVYRTHVIAGEGSIEENNSDTAYNAIVAYPWVRPVLDNDSDRYIFYIDSNNDVHLIMNDGGGWTDLGSIQWADDYEQVIPEWAYNNENQPTGRINYLFSVGQEIWYQKYPLDRRIFAATV